MVLTYPPLDVTRAGETATERRTRSIEPRATAAHSLRRFQPTHAHNNFTVTLSIDEPILRREAADVDDRSEPTKVPSRDFRGGRRVKVHAEIWGLRKGV